MGIGIKGSNYNVPQILHDAQNSIIQFKSIQTQKGITVFLSSGGYLYFCGGLKDSYINSAIPIKISSLDNEVVKLFLIYNQEKLII